MFLRKTKAIDQITANPIMAVSPQVVPATRPPNHRNDNPQAIFFHICIVSESPPNRLLQCLDTNLCREPPRHWSPTFCHIIKRFAKPLDSITVAPACLALKKSLRHGPRPASRQRHAPKICRRPRGCCHCVASHDKTKLRIVPKAKSRQPAARVRRRAPACFGWGTVL